MWTDLRAVAYTKQRQGDCNHSKKVLKTLRYHGSYHFAVISFLAQIQY